MEPRTGMQWIWCDIDGSGKKWRLAICRDMDDGEDGLYFPIEDFHDYMDGFSDYPMELVVRPKPLVVR